MRRLILLLLVAGGVLVACGGGGGGGGSSPVPVIGGGTHGGSTGQAKISVLIPKGSSTTSVAKRAPHSISSGTAQLEFQVVSVNGASPSPTLAPQIVSITDPQYCTSTTNGTSCSVPVTVPVATAVVIQISTLDASGNVLGTGLTAAIDTTQATIPTQNVSIGGVPAKIILSENAGSALDDGTVHQIVLSVSAQDASGNTILPPGTYGAPITLSVSNDPNGALSLSMTTVNAPGSNGGVQNVTLTYDSSKRLTSQAIITAQGGTANNSVLFAPLVISPLNVNSLAVGGANGSLNVSEPGYSGSFSIAAPTFVSTSCSPSNCTPSAPGGSVTITVVPYAAGSGTIAIRDLTGGRGAIPVAVAQTSGGGGLVGGPYKIYEYPTGATSGGGSYGITVGSTGQTLWFVDRVNATLGYVLNPSSCNGATCSVGEISGLPGIQPPLPVALQSIAAAPDGNLYITDLGNYSTDDGEIFQETCSDATGTCSSGVGSTSFGFLSTPAPSDVKVAVDGNIYAASAYATTAPSAPPGNSAIISVGIANFSSFPTSFIIQAAPDPSRPAFLAYDPLDQYMWFTDSGNGNVGFFPLGCSTVRVCNVTEQPAGTVVNTSTLVVRHGSNGSMTGALPKSLAGIVAASDGYLYVAVPSAHEIARINAATWTTCSGTSCSYDVIALPQANASPEQLTIGSDGNVWFTDTSGFIGMIPLATCSTSCKAYEYAVPTQAGAPWGIVNGPDGNIWFTESASAKIGEVVLR